MSCGTRKLIKFSHEYLENDFLLREEIIKKPKASLFAKLIDSTLLKQSATKNQIETLCQESIQYNFRSICVPPSYIPYCKELLINSNIRTCSVVGFPLGYNTIETKLNEIEQLISFNVDEIDFVQNATHIKNNCYDLLENEYKSIVSVAKGALVKVILETALLTEEEIYKCSYLAALSGIHVVKTSTGFSTRGASLNDIQIIKKALNQYLNDFGFFVGIKASGGIRSYQDAVSLVQAGATRLGTSGGIEIINEKVNFSSY